MSSPGGHTGGRRSAALTAALIAVPSAIVAGLVAFSLMGGFTRTTPPEPAGRAPVQVQAPPSSATADAVCAKLLGALPLKVLDQSPRSVTAAPHRVVAWGDPAIVLRCGVGKPKSLTRSSQLLGIQGVEWVYDTEGDTTVWTTTSLSLYVEVRVPGKYRYQASTRILNPLAATLKANVPPAK